MTMRRAVATLTAAVFAALPQSPAAALTCTVVVNSGLQGSLDCLEDDPTSGEGVHGVCNYDAQPIAGNLFLVDVDGTAQTLPAAFPALSTQIDCQVVDATGVAVASVGSFVFGATASAQTTVVVSAVAPFSLCMFAEGIYGNGNAYTIGWLCA